VALTDVLLEDAAVVVTLVVLEAVLSFDNAAILAALSRRLPLGEGRRRALNYGLLIAYFLRVAAILCVFLLIRYPATLAVGGAYLIFLFGKHYVALALGKGGEHAHASAGGTDKPFLSRFGISAFTAIIIQIGVVDLAFAMDQVVAAVGFTQKVYLIIIAATIGLVSLRLLAPYLSRLMDWLPSLEHIAYLAVGFVGVLLMGETIGLEGGFHFVHHSDHDSDPPLFVMSKVIKVGITLGLFLIPILVKLIFKWPKDSVTQHAQIEESLREKDRPNLSVESLEKAHADKSTKTEHKRLK
jgi:YkoY family integral membrane protein